MLNNTIEVYSRKWKTKQKQKNIITKPIKKNCRKDHQRINYANIKYKNKSDWDREKIKGNMGNYYHKRKHFSNHLINCVKELGNVGLRKF